MVIVKKMSRPSLSLDDIRPWAEQATSLYAKSKKHVKSEFDPNPEINNLISFLPRGDSTTLAIDAIVNAANSGLAPGGGICGAIHDVAGPELWDACRKIGHCDTGGAVITPGFNLPAKYCIHAVGPIGECPKELESAYKAVLGLVDGENVRSVGFCCISTGIYGYPIESATKVALRTVREWLEDEENRKKVDRIIFVVFLSKDVSVYKKLLPIYFPLEKSEEGDVIGSEDEEEEEEEEERGEEGEEEEEEEEKEFEVATDKAK